MAASHARNWVCGLLLFGGISYLAYAANSSSWAYYRDVDAFLADAPRPGTRARVHGRVAAEGADIRPVDLSARFTLRGEHAALAVEFRGAVPALLAPGGQVVAEGTLGADAVFRADVLLTKCASKYDSDSEAPPSHRRARP